MKKLYIGVTFFAAAIVLAVFFSSCATYPAAGPSVCAAPEAAGSWICAVAAKYNFSPEQMDSILLDANTVALISGAYDREKAIAVVVGIKEYVENFTLSYTTLITFILRDTQNAQLLAQMVSRHLTLFKSAQVISPFDKGLIVAHLDHQLALLGCPSGECR